MQPASSLGIENQELVTEYFGHWPSFHDAEILSLAFERGQAGYWPIISLKIQLAGPVKHSSVGVLQQTRHCLLELEFHGVQDNEIEGFNHQNVVFEINFRRENDLITCDISPSYGVGGTITAQRLVVKNLLLMDEPPTRG